MRDNIETLLDFVDYCKESKNFRAWLDCALNWSRSRDVDVALQRVAGDWVLKLKFSDSKGAFFDYAYKINGKRGDTDSTYRDRVWRDLDKTCMQVRKARMQQIVVPAKEAEAA